MLIVDKRNIIVHSSLNGGLVEDFGVFLSIFQPSNSGFFPPQGFFLLSSFFDFDEDFLLLLSVFFRSAFRNDVLLQVAHILLKFFLMGEYVSEL